MTIPMWTEDIFRHYTLKHLNVCRVYDVLRTLKHIYILDFRFTIYDYAHSPSLKNCRFTILDLRLNKSDDESGSQTIYNLKFTIKTYYLF